MKRRHLKQEQLAALRDGQSSDEHQLEHLASCSTCQAAFQDSRWTLLLARLRGGATAEHPDAERMRAYSDNALSPSSADRLTRHLRSCDRCLARYRRLARAERELASSPSPELLKRTRARFRPRPFRRLGALVLHSIGRRVFLDYETESLPPPESAAWFESRIAERTEDLGGSMVADPSYGLGAELERTHSSMPTVHIDAGRFELEAALPSSEPRRVRVRLTHVEDDRAAAGLRLRFSSDSGADVEVSTDAAGYAEAELPPACSRLTIEDDPPLLLRIVGFP